MKSTSNYLFRSMRKNKSVKISSFIYSLKITLLLLLLLSISCYSQFKLPNYEIVQLDNGLTVYLMEKKNVPIVSISVVIEAGAIKDGELNGIASFTA